ncbi:NAD(P)-binding protein [Rhodobacteraceae bacterium D3-12]|nr:NAD(P)-binding protein [Rhodobacteraceae bacterium D3-12]
MVNRKTVAVIGGGVSGLAAAKAFDERGHRVCGFERSHDLGGVWELSRSYPGVQTQSPKPTFIAIPICPCRRTIRSGPRGRRFMRICTAMPASMICRVCSG